MKPERRSNRLKNSSKPETIASENGCFTEAEKKTDTDNQKTGAFLRSNYIYRELVDGMNDTVWVIDLNGNLLDVNKTAETALGYSKDEFLTMGLFGIDSSLRIETIRSLVKKMPREKLQIFETSHKTKSGKIIPVEISSSIINYLGEKAILSIARDISDRRQAALDLQKSEELYRNLIERTPDGVYKSTHEGRFVEVNPAMVKMLGYNSKEELMSIDIKTQLYFEPTDRESLTLQERFEELGIFRLKKKDGSELWVEDHGWYTHNEKGEILFHEGILRDISERRRTEDALRASEERYRVFINATKDMAFLKNEKFQYLLVNDALTTFFGRNNNEIIGKQDVDLMPEKAANRCRETDLEALESNKLVVSEEVIQDKIYETSKFRVPFDKERYGIGGYIRDVTEKRRSELQMIKQAEELKELNATKDKFFSIIAHDMRGPFNSILGFSDLLLENYRDLDGGTLEKSLQAIHGASNQAYALLENLLLWSRAQTGRVDYKPEVIYLQEKVLQNIRLLKIQANKKNIQLTSNIPSNLKVLADRNMMDTILRNLLTNALKFTPRNGKIEVSAIIKNKQVEISVTDNGIGIPKENFDKIFRIDSKTSTLGTEKEKGSGLGLILCKEFAERNGGKIWVESELEKGSTFRFTIPVNE